VRKKCRAAQNDGITRQTLEFAKLPDLLPEIRKLSGAATKKLEPQFSAVFGFLLLTLAFEIRGFMRWPAKAKRPLSM